MKAKTLLLTSLFAAASGAVASAQSTPVYSQNVVGYTSLSIAPGYNLIANQLVTANNKIPQLFPNVPGGTTVYKFNNATGQFSINQYDADFQEWLDPNQTLSPGEGAFVLNPTTQPFSVTFVGEVTQGSTTNSLPAGYSLKSSIVPQAGALQAVLGYTPGNGDTVYRWNGNGYDIHQYDGDFQEWGGGDPVLRVAEGFFLLKPVASNWVRTFNVN
jgi:hypothetical protein